MHLRFGVLLATFALLLAACSGITPGPQAELDTLAKGGNGKAQGKKPIVEDPTPDPVSECVALYASGDAQATTTNAVIDPQISYGEIGTLILSFNFEDALAPAADFVTATLGLESGEGLGVFENLPILAVKTLITPSLVDNLKTNLQGYGLLSIYQDQPLQYFLNSSADFIGAPAARADFDVSGAGVGVAVIDSGVDGTQGDFANVVQNVKIVGPIVDVGAGGYLYVETPNSDLTSGHGTHVAGTIGGQGTMSDGKYTGIAPGVNLVGIGSGDAISILYALEGFDYALDPDNMAAYNIRVISNSWGTSGQRFAPFNPISIVSKRAYDLGVVVDFAAGNDGPDADTLNPYSASPCVISVAAGDKSGYLADFSSRGVPGDAYHHPDITAPGVDIIAPRATTGPVTPPYEGDLDYGLYYSMISGTSMATPHISGVVALLLEVDPSLNTDGVLAYMTETARPMYYGGTEDGLDPAANTAQHELYEVGAGYVDAYAAVQAAAENVETRTSTETSQLDSWTGSVDLAVSVPLVGDLVAAEDTYTLDVPAGVAELRIVTDWGNPALDLDLYIFDPNGNPIASSAQGASVSEAVAIPSPAAGSYLVQLKGYLNTPTDYTGTAEIDVVTTF